MIVVSYHDDLKEVQGADALRAAAPFDHPEWFHAMVDHCEAKPLFAVAQGDGALAILPLQRDGNRLAALANWYTFRWRPLSDHSPTPHQLLGALARDLRKHNWRIVLSPLPEEDGVAELLAKTFASAGWRVQFERCDTNHVLPVAGRSFAQYLASRSGPLRTTLKRKASRLEVSLNRDFDPASWAEFEAIYAASWKPQEGSPAFLRELAEREGKAGRLRLALARSEGVPVAAQFWTVEGGTAWIHKLAHRDDARSLSPGTVLTAALLEEVIDQDRVELVDFGTGDEPYKRDWMESNRARFRIDALNPANPRSWPHLVRRGFRRLVQGSNAG